MKNYGKTIREIRVSKGMTLKDVADQTISLPFLSKYERGLCDISVSHFLNILDKLNISLNEFELCHATMTKSDQLSFIEQLKEIFRTDNIFLCNKFILKEEEYFKIDNNIRHQHNIIILNQYVNKLSNINYNKDQIKKIINYLLKVEDWSYYELTLYGNSLFFLPIENILFLLKMAVKKSQQFKYINANKNELCLIINNVITLILESDKPDKKSNLMMLFNLLDNELENTKFYYEINKTNFLKGIFLLQGGNHTGKDKCLESINIMSKMGNDDLAHNHQIYLDKVLFNLYENK